MTTATTNSEQDIIVNQILTEAERAIFSNTGFTVRLRVYQDNGLKELYTRSQQPWDHLKSVLVNYYNLTWEDISGPSRKRNVTMARFCWCYIGYKLLRSKSLASIGSQINRDHTSVMYSIKSFEGWLDVKDIQAVHAFETIIQKLQEPIAA